MDHLHEIVCYIKFFHDVLLLYSTALTISEEIKLVGGDRRIVLGKHIDLTEQLVEILQQDLLQQRIQCSRTPAPNMKVTTALFAILDKI